MLLTGSDIESIARRTAELLHIMNDEIMSAKQCAEMLDISVEALHKRCEMEQIPYHRKHRRLYFFKNEIQDFVKKKPASR